MIHYTDLTGAPAHAHDLGWPDGEAERQILANAHPDDHDRLRQVFDERRAAEQEHMSAATAEQADIGWGDYFSLPWQPPGEHDPIMVYGHVLSVAAVRTFDALSVGVIERGYGRGWRITHSFSAVGTDDGTLGGHHVCQMTPIAEWEFDAAEMAGWRSVPLLLTGGTQLPCGCPLVPGCLNPAH